jgi:hypothetical protein
MDSAAHDNALESGLPRGLELARGFYEDVVGPLLDLPHAACLIGEGSEVLGYDDAQSRDHEWGPRLQVFVDPDHVHEVQGLVASSLPSAYRGLPTVWFSLSAGKPTHHVEIADIGAWLSGKLPSIPQDPMSTPDAATWLTLPQQHLLQLTAGAVFRDDLGDLTRLRERFTWYPVDIWRWLIASQWQLLSTAAPTLGRAVQLGDELGTRILTARCCQLVLEMTLLQARSYRPYPKWSSRAFTELDSAGSVSPLLLKAMRADAADCALDVLLEALVLLAEDHNTLDITAPVPPRIAPFDVGINNAVRPYKTLNFGEFIDATVASLEDPALRDLPRVGGIDQLTHADDQLINFTGWPMTLREDFRQHLSEPRL